MRISLNDSFGDTYVYEVAIRRRRGLSLDGNLYMTMMYISTPEITWDVWQLGSGKVIYGDDSELSRFHEWAAAAQEREARFQALGGTVHEA